MKRLLTVSKNDWLEVRLLSFNWAQLDFGWRVKTKTCNHLKVLETKDVEDTNGLEVFFSFDFLVDFHYDPGETLRIERHGNWISWVHSLQTKSGHKELLLPCRISHELKSINDYNKYRGNITIMSPYIFTDYICERSILNSVVYVLCVSLQAAGKTVCFHNRRSCLLSGCLKSGALQAVFIVF